MDLARICSACGIPTLLHKFEEERIDAAMVGRLSDAELVRLGVTTIGERVRLKEKVREVRNLYAVSLRT